MNENSVIETLTQETELRRKMLTTKATTTERVFVWCAVGFYIVFIAVTLVAQSVEYSQYALGVSLFFAILLIGIGFLDVLQIAKRPSTTYSKGVVKQIEFEMHHASAIERFDDSNLNAAKRRLAFELDRIKGRSPFYLGALEKLGLAPAVASLYFVYTEPIKSISLGKWIEEEKLTVYIGAGIICLYLGFMALRRVVSQYEQYIFIIDEVLQRRVACEAEPSVEADT